MAPVLSLFLTDNDNHFQLELQKKQLLHYNVIGSVEKMLLIAVIIEAIIQLIIG